MTVNSGLSLAARLRGSRFIKNVAVVAGGSAGAQAVSILTAPILTRVFGPEIYGVVGLLTAISAIMVSVAGLAYPLAIPIPQADEEARSLVLIAISSSAFLSVITAVALLSAGPTILAAMHLTAMLPVMMVLPVLFFLTCLTQVGMQWQTRTRQFKAGAKIAISASVLSSIFKVAAGVLVRSPLALALSTALSTAANGAMLWYSGQSMMPTKATVDLRRLRQIAREYRDFPYYRAPQMFLNALTAGLPVMTLTASFGPRTAAFYALAYTVTTLPMMVVGTAITNVFQTKIVDATRSGQNVRPLLIHTSALLLAVGVAPFTTLIFFGAPIFEIVFGVEWHSAGSFAGWLSLWMAAVLANRPAVAAVPVLRIQGKLLIFEVVSIAIRFGALLVGAIVFHDPGVAVALFCAAGAALALVIWIVVYFSAPSAETLVAAK